MAKRIGKILIFDTIDSLNLSDIENDIMMYVESEDSLYVSIDKKLVRLGGFSHGSGHVDATLDMTISEPLGVDDGYRILNTESGRASVNNQKVIQNAIYEWNGRSWRELKTTKDTVIYTKDTNEMLVNVEGVFTAVTNKEIEDNVIANEQGHYSLLSSIYFGGTATETLLTTEQTGQWIDVVLTIDPSGTFDFRPDEMKEQAPLGHIGTGALADPICFKLEGLTQQGSASLRVSMNFEPDEDEGRLDSVAMESGADILYPNSPDIQFFIGDTIDTNAPGDAGTVQFQIKSDVAGTVYINEMALFIQV
jgi:hypothetical protein